MLYKIHELSRIHGNTTILDLDALEIASGKIYTLIGPNGAGKTTLLNILAFLDHPTHGSIQFRGEPVTFSENKLHHLRQKISLVDQYPILFSGTVRKNVEFGLKVRGIAKNKRINVVEEVLDMVGMTRFIDADARNLSGGETKRIALARALAIEPQVLLCDEPTANVDAENQEIILDILKRCNKEKNVSLIFATHYLSQAVRLADHTIILQNGRLSSVQRENVFAATLQKRNGVTAIYQLGNGLILHIGDEHGTLPEGGTIYIDPKKITLHPGDSLKRSMENTWAGKVQKLERVNHSIKITVDCGVQLDVLLSLKQYRRNPVNIEEATMLQIPVDSSMFF